MAYAFLGAAGVFALAAVLLYLRLQGVKERLVKWRSAAEERKAELKEERSRGKAQLDDLHARIKALTARLVECRDPDAVRNWLDDVFASVRREDGSGGEDPPPVP